MNYFEIFLTLILAGLLVYMRREILAIAILFCLFVLAVFLGGAFLVLVTIYIVWLGITKGIKK